jgi:hypothetical protein
MACCGPGSLLSLPSSAFGIMAPALPAVTNGCYKCGPTPVRRLFSASQPAAPVLNFRRYALRGVVGGETCGVDGTQYYQNVTVVPPVLADAPVQVRFQCKPTALYIQSPVTFTGGTLANGSVALFAHPDTNLVFGCAEDMDGVLQWTADTCIGEPITDTWLSVAHANRYQPLLVTNFKNTATSAVTRRLLRAVPVDGEAGLYNLVWSVEGGVGLPFAFRLTEITPPCY